MAVRERKSKQGAPVYGPIYPNHFLIAPDASLTSFTTSTTLPTAMSTSDSTTTASADPTNPAPTYIYKLIPHTAAPPSPLPDALPVSALDQSSGFLHMSTALQVPRTLAHFFTNDPRVYVARVPYAPLEKDIRWEDPKGDVCGPRAGEGMFPHIYNGFQLGKDEIESVQEWVRGEGGWEEAVKKAQDEGWFVY